MPDLAGFLRSCRERMEPRGGGRRRTPGLRREEVAEAAGMSVDYYSRLVDEQSQEPAPSQGGDELPGDPGIVAQQGLDAALRPQATFSAFSRSPPFTGRAMTVTG